MKIISIFTILLLLSSCGKEPIYEYKVELEFCNNKPNEIVVYREINYDPYIWSVDLAVPEFRSAWIVPISYHRYNVCDFHVISKTLVSK